MSSEVSQEAKKKHDEYMKLCKKYKTPFETFKCVVECFKKDCPVDATCITMGNVDEMLGNIQNMIEWIDGTLSSSPEDYDS